MMENSGRHRDERATRLRLAWHVAAISLIAALIVWRVGGAGRGAGAQEAFPTRPIEVIVPYDAGGGTDTLARLVQRSIARGGWLDQPMVILNLPGGSGTIGSRHVKNSRPDGHRILCLDEGVITSKLSGTVPFGAEDFDPIAQSTVNTTVVTVREDSPFADLAALMARAVESPGSLRFGVPLGTPPHFSAKKLQRARPGAEFNFIQSMGGQKRYSLLLGQHIDVAIFSLAEVLAYRAAEGSAPEKQIRPLAVLADARHPSLPAVATAIEQGLDAVGGNSLYWWAPKGTPAERIGILADAIESAMEEPELKEELRRLSIDGHFRRGEELIDWIRQRTADLAEVALDPEVQLPNFPLYLGGLVGALGIAMLVLPAAPRDDDADPRAAMSLRSRSALICAGLLLLYILVLALEAVPYPWATAAMVFAVGGTIAAWNRDRLLLLAEIALLTGFGAEAVFTRVFNVVLP